jgi:hypothetical protein
MVNSLVVGAIMAENGLLNTVIRWITADVSVFWLSWAGLVIGFVLSIWIAWRFYGIVKDIDAAMIFAGQDIPQYKLRKPILNRIEKLERQAGNGLSIVIWRSTAMTFFGMLVPGLLLALLVHYQDSLLPGPSILLAGNDPMPQGAVSYFDTAIFVLDQALRGALNDLMEVFDLSLTPISNNPDQGVYTTLVFFYRLTCGTIAGAIVFAALKVFTGTRALNQALSNLKRQLAAMDEK